MISDRQVEAAVEVAAEKHAGKWGRDEYAIAKNAARAALEAAAGARETDLVRENWQLKAACGYPIPADINTDPNPFKCGICGARNRRLGESIGEWVSVPREATEEMVAAAPATSYMREHAHGTGHHAWYPTLQGPRDIWKAMIAAAPASPANVPREGRATVYQIEESEGLIRLSVGGVEVCAHQHDTSEGIALLKFDYLQHLSAAASAIAKLDEHRRNKFGNGHGNGPEEPK